MNIQDRKKTLTVEELRRRYNLDSLDKDRKAIKMAKEQLNKVDSELNNFVEITTKNIKELQDQVDGNITTWFFNGVPTLNNEPANSWTTDEDKINHLGDLYYDQDTGYAYRWAVESNIYSWSKIVDADVVEALAVANSAQDTADSKRRVFVTNPIPPYDIGDIWIKDDQDLYRCRASRESGTMNIADWILATKYTDDTVALGTKAELDQFKTEVTENYVTNATLETTASSISGRVEETYTYVTNVEHQVNDITTTTQTSIGGNNLYLEDALESNALEYHVDGKSEQETSVQGKNLFDIIGQFKKLYGTSVTVNSTVFTLLENGKINIKGTPTKRTQLAITTGSATSKDIIVPLDSTKTYTFSTNFNQKSISLYYLDTTDTIKPIYMNGATTKSISNAKGIVYINIDIQTLIAYDADYYFQIEQGTATTYEPFVPNSPSPDYPSEIKSIPSISNLFDKDNANILNCYVNNNGVISLETARSIYIPITGGKTYTITRNGSKRLRAITTDVLPSNGVSKIDIINNDPVNSITISTSTNSKYLVVYFYLTSDENDKTIEETMATIQIEEGSIAHPYIPYGTWTKVKITGKNLFDKTIYQQAYITNTGSIAIASEVALFDYINIDSSSKYMLSLNKSITGYRYALYDSNKTFISRSDEYKTNITISTSSNAKYIRFFFNIDNSAITQEKIDNLDIQFEENTVATEYEPYQEKEVLIDLNIYDEEGNITGHHELSSIGDTKDTLDIVNGQVVIDKKIDEVVLDGISYKAISKSGNTNNMFNITNINNIKNPNNNSDKISIISTHFKDDYSADELYANKDLIGIAGKVGSIVAIAFGINSEITTIEQANEWLKSNNVSVYYPLAESKQIILPNVQIPLFEGVNHISLVDDLETTTSIKYYRNTPIAQDYVVQQQLDGTNSNLANATNKIDSANKNYTDLSTNLSNNYYNKGQIDNINSSTTERITKVEKSVESSITSTQAELMIKQAIDTGINRIETTTGYTFDKDGLHTKKSDDPRESLVDNTGIYVNNGSTNMLTANDQGVSATNLTANNFIILYPIRQQKTTSESDPTQEGLGFFYIGA